MMPTNDNLSDADYLRFCELVHKKSGLDFSGHRRPDLERAIRDTLVETAACDAASLFGLLTEGQLGQRVLDTFIARLTIGETYFFRNRPQFAALEQHILPDIIARRRAVRRLRIWSAGCASGEEPYSLAILLRRLLPDLAEWNVLILATDISVQALEKAQRGVYGRWSFREDLAEIHETYFSPYGRDLMVVPLIRNMVSFAQLNLAEDVYPSFLTNTHSMDLIVCRNVTIYFREETTRRVVGRFYKALTDDGWLVVGHTEPSQTIYHQFAVRNLPDTVVYQKEVVERQTPEPQNAAAPFSLLDIAFGTTQEHRHTSQPPPAQSSKPQRAAYLAPTDQQRILPDEASAEQQPTSRDELYQQAIALDEANQPDQALRCLEALAAIDSQDAYAPYLAAKIAANRQQLVAATHWITLAVQRAPLMAMGHYLHALILQERHQEDEALEALRRCIYADPQFVLGHIALTNACVRLGQPRRARKALETVFQLLRNRERDALIPAGEGLTVGRVLDMIAQWKDL